LTGLGFEVGVLFLILRVAVLALDLVPDGSVLLTSVTISAN